MPVSRRVKHQGAQRIGPVVSQKEEERTLLVLLHKLDALPCPKISGIAGFLTDPAVLNDLLIVKFPGAAIGLRHPERKTLRGFEVFAEVPLAAESAYVARITQHFAERRKFLEGVIRLRARHVFLIEKGMHAVLRGKQTRQKRSPRR